MFSKETYQQRRTLLRRQVESGLLLFLGNQESGMNYADNTYPFRQDSTFLYYFGSDYAGLAAVIDIDKGTETIFGDELTIDHIVWMGTQPTIKEKSERVGVSETRPFRALHNTLQEAISKGRAVHFLPPYRPEHQIALFQLLGIGFDRQKEMASVPFIKAVVNQRNYKSDEEVAQIQEAALITAHMHLASMQLARAGMRESEIAAAVTAVALQSGGSLSFPVIATINGQILHNHYHGNSLREGQLFLLDAGAENVMHYCGDMSSTIPVSKRFTSRQKDIYNVTVAAHDAAVAMLKPGVPFLDAYNQAAITIAEGMKSLGLMKGSIQDAVAEGAHAMFFQCGLGHMMGLDVHDMENLGEVWVGYNGVPKSTQFGRKSLRLARELEPGFVLTIEPGIYFIPELMDMWQAEKRFTDFICYDKLQAYRDFGGIRNEEDYLITPTGKQLLGKPIPRTVESIEQMR
ncbi:MAG: aminopeptidase P family protein [Bacteroidales bacterium]